MFGNGDEIMAKNYEESRYGRYGVLSKTMINMALWVDDKEMYPHAVFVTDDKELSIPPIRY